MTDAPSFSRPEWIKYDVALSEYTSWQVGGRADYFSEPSSAEQIESCVLWAFRNNLPVSILGMGTNTLVSDRGVRGLVLCLSKWDRYTVETERLSDSDFGRVIISAQSGMSKSELLKVFLKLKLEPAVFLAGIPGDLGGGVAMNAGVGEQIVPREFCEIVDEIEVWSLTDPIQKKIYKSSELIWGYRFSKGWQPGVIVNVKLSWPHQPKQDVLERVKSANQVRLKKQPLDMPSCGSVFANPSVETKAGQLIEACGLKGFRVGQAQVSTKHANFIVNLGGATATEIDAVISKVQQEVKAQKGIWLRHEVVYLGDWAKA